MYLNDHNRIRKANFAYVKPGHEMYLNFSSASQGREVIFVKPGHEMYLNNFMLTLEAMGYKLNQDMRCI